MSKPEFANAETPFRPIHFAPVEVECEQASNGTIRYRSRARLEPYEPSLARLFRAAVERAPGRVLFAERDLMWIVAVDRTFRHLAFAVGHFNTIAL